MHRRHGALPIAALLSLLAAGCPPAPGNDAAGRDAGARDTAAPDTTGHDAARSDSAGTDVLALDAFVADAANHDSALPDRPPVDIGSSDVEYIQSVELTTHAAALALLRSGQPADLDGDGTPDTTRAVEGGGAVSSEQDLNNDGLPEWRYAYDGNGVTIQSIDSDSDGWPEQELTVTVTASEERKVLLSDTDLDGVADRRQTWVTLLSAPNDQNYTDETDATGSGTWTTVTSTVISKTKFVDDPCMDGFPSDGTDWNPWSWLPNITIRTGNSGGACSADQARLAAAAVDCALARGGLCLAMTNSALNASLNAAVNGDNVMPLLIGCGNGCANSLAATRSWSRPWFSDSQMNLGAGFWGLDAPGRCNIMLHEMLHWAGNEGSADHNESTGPGDDQVYSCGRYCGRCSDAAHGSPNNSAIDCARCADSKSRKEACGSQTEYQTAGCGDYMTGICHSGLACIAGNCEQCGGVVTNDCNGALLRLNVDCCSQCPTGCDRSNDFPCGTPPMSTDSCTDGNPPNCH